MSCSLFCFISSAFPSCFKFPHLPHILYSPDSEAIGVLTTSLGGVACLRFDRFGAGMLVPLRGAAAGCCCSVLEGAAFRGVSLEGAAARCCLRVLL